MNTRDKTTLANMLDPDMPTQELRLHMGELSAQEERTARAAIRWANAAMFPSLSSTTTDAAEQEVLKYRGSYDAPGFDECLATEIKQRAGHDCAKEKPDNDLPTIEEVRGIIPMEQVRQREMPDKPVHDSRYQVGEKAIADCLPHPDDENGIYHLDYGNLQALVHTAIEIHERTTKRVFIKEKADDMALSDDEERVQHETFFQERDNEIEVGDK